jgi:hypothetical protein
VMRVFTGMFLSSCDAVVLCVFLEFSSVGSVQVVYLFL